MNKIKNPELESAIQFYQDVLIDSTHSIQHRVTSDKVTFLEESLFERERRSHQALLDQMVEDYINKNEAFLRDTFDIFMLGKSIQYDFSQSKYFNRGYTQRILNSIRQAEKVSA